MGIGKSFLGEFNNPKPPVAPAPPAEEPTKTGGATATTGGATASEVIGTTGPIGASGSQAPPTPPIDDKKIDTPPVAPPVDDKTPPVDKPPVVEINDESLKSYFKEKYGKDVEDVGNLFKEPDAPVDQLEGISPEMQAYLKFHKDTNGRSFEEFNALNRDLTKLSPLEIAREKAIASTKGKISKEDVDDYLENKLNIDLSDSENIGKFDLIELESFGEDYLKEQTENKEKYKTPKAKSDGDFVTLDNGTQMTAKAFQEATDKRNQYVESIKSATDKITAASFNIKIDDNGTEKTMALSVDYSKEDLHNMGSNALDIDKAFVSIFGDEKGEIDPKALQEGLFWAKSSNREKLVHKIVHNALAEQAKEYLQDEHNIPGNTNRMPSKNGSSKRVPVPGAKTNYGPKYDFNNV
jgi:hypothetical protein